MLVWVQRFAEMIQTVELVEDTQSHDIGRLIMGKMGRWVEQLAGFVIRQPAQTDCR